MPRVPQLIRSAGGTFPRVLPQRLVERSDADAVAAGELAAGVEVFEPEAHGVLRAALGAEGLERSHVEDRIVLREREVQKRRRGRDADALQLEQRCDPF